MKKLKGYCRICNDYKVLENDHIPPKSCFNRDVITIYEYIGNESIGVKYNGFQIKSICSECNRLLGNNYDSELSAFAKNVMMSYYQMRLGRVVFNKLEFKYDFNKILRSIIGHLLSATGYKINIKEPFDSNPNYTLNKMRKSLLNNENTYFDETIIYLWIHPYRSIEIQNNFSYKPHFGSKSIMLGSMLKFFPLGFLLIDKKLLNNEFSFNLDEITINDKKIILNMTKIMPDDFPYNLVKDPSSSGIFLINSASAIRGQKSLTYRGSTIYKLF